MTYKTIMVVHICFFIKQQGQYIAFAEVQHIVFKNGYIDVGDCFWRRMVLVMLVQDVGDDFEHFGLQHPIFLHITGTNIQKM